MVDGWMGDDWFHFGAFRQTNFDYFTEQTTVKGDGRAHRARGLRRLRELPARGIGGRLRQGRRLDQLPCWRKTVEHPAYDAFWQDQALDKTMAAQPLKVPTMWIQGLWDQEDMWGAIHSYLAVEPKDAANDELSRDGSVAPQRRELRRLLARAAEAGTATRRCNSAATC